MSHILFHFILFYFILLKKMGKNGLPLFMKLQYKSGLYMYVYIFRLQIFGLEFEKGCLFCQSSHSWLTGWFEVENKIIRMCFVGIGLNIFCVWMENMRNMPNKVIWRIHDIWTWTYIKEDFILKWKKGWNTFFWQFIRYEVTFDRCWLIRFKFQIVWDENGFM